MAADLPLLSTPEVESEHKLHVACVQYLDAHEILYTPSVSGATLTGASKWKQINAMQQRGWKKGFPDLHIPEIGYRGEPGLYIELKRRPNRLEPEQREWQKKLRMRGYIAEEVTTLADFVRIIQTYVYGNGAPFARCDNFRKQEPREATWEENVEASGDSQFMELAAMIQAKRRRVSGVERAEVAAQVEAEFAPMFDLGLRPNPALVGSGSSEPITVD